MAARRRRRDRFQSTTVSVRWDWGYAWLKIASYVNVYPLSLRMKYNVVLCRTGLNAILTFGTTAFAENGTMCVAHRSLRGRGKSKNLNNDVITAIPVWGSTPGFNVYHSVMRARHLHTDCLIAFLPNGFLQKTLHFPKTHAVQNSFFSIVFFKILPKKFQCVEHFFPHRTRFLFT